MRLLWQLSLRSQKCHPKFCASNSFWDVEKHVFCKHLMPVIASESSFLQHLLYFSQKAFCVKRHWIGHYCAHVMASAIGDVSPLLQIGWKVKHFAISGKCWVIEKLMRLGIGIFCAINATSVSMCSTFLRYGKRRLATFVTSFVLALLSFLFCYLFSVSLIW